jgi:hypothetical protein
MYRVLKGRFQLHVLLGSFNPINKFYRVLKDSFQLHVLLPTVNPINTIVPCAEGEIFSCMFCWLLSILSIQFYLVLKGMFQLHVLLVTVNPINRFCHLTPHNPVALSQ